MSGVSALLLLFPGSALDAIWKFNPSAPEEFSKMGLWAVVLMAAVCLLCALATIGVWKRKWWGHRLACGIIVVNLVGDVVSAIVRSDARTLIGLPIGGALLAYLLSRRVRRYFAE